MIWAIYRIHYGLDFLEPSIKSIINEVDKIFIFYSKDPWIKTRHINYKKKTIDFPQNPENVESFLISKYNKNEKVTSNISSKEWERIFDIKEEVNQKIEALRNENKLKGSLDAIVLLTAEKKDKEILDKLGDELHFLFITSEAQAQIGGNFTVNIENSSNNKCVRCWHKDKSVGSNQNHIELCNRCILNIEEDGEERQFV